MTATPQTLIDTQPYVALDLEYNQPSGTIIQVGVAIGSAAHSQQEYAIRRWNLKVDEPISEFITQLTGITDEDCQAGVSLAQCAAELGELLNEHAVFVNPVTWGGRRDARLGSPDEGDFAHQPPDRRGPSRDRPH